MPNDQVDPVAPLFAPLQMFVQGGNSLLSQFQSLTQSFLNVGAMNLQDVSQTVQRGQAQLVSGFNQGIAGIEGVAKKPLVDIQQVAQGGSWPITQGGQAPNGQQAPAPQPAATTFSPPQAGGADMNTRPAYGEQYFPMTMEQSDFTEGGFQESPRGTDQPVQQKNIETLFM